MGWLKWLTGPRDSAAGIDPLRIHIGDSLDSVVQAMLAELDASNDIKEA